MARVCTYYRSCGISYIQTSMNFRTLMQYFQTHLGTEAYYLFFILSYYENEMYTVLTFLSFIHTVILIQVSYLNAAALFLCLILQKKSREDGIYLFY